MRPSSRRITNCTAQELWNVLEEGERAGDAVHEIVAQDGSVWRAHRADETCTFDLAQTAATPAFTRLEAFMLTLPLFGNAPLMIDHISEVIA